MSFFYSSVPLADSKKCPKTEQHNRLAKEVNSRIESAGPASAWSIFYYADSMFTGMRNTATPGQPLGVNPPEDEWWKVYAHIDLPTAQTGEGNWPLTGAGMPQGANVMNPINAYIFGRVTYENKLFENRMGPWAEGNLFDGLVQSSRAVLSNSNYWEDSFRQRGAYKVNLSYFENVNINYPDRKKAWRKGKYPYLPSPYDKVYFSKSLSSAGRSSDYFFPEYASQHVYARYAPRESGNKIIRKNATKDVLKWMLWAYTYYFRGSEQQRSLFCEAKSWDTPLLDFNTTGEYKGQQTYGMKRVRSYGGLSVCDVGFDFFSYMTRQNILAPVLAARFPKGFRNNIDGTGNIKLEQYRPEFNLKITQGNVDNNFLGTVNGEQININYRNLSSINKTQTQDNSTNRRKKVIGFENYDEVDETGQIYNIPRYGKTLRFTGDADKDDEDRTVYNETMLLKCSYDNMSPGGTPIGSKVFPLAGLDRKSKYIPYCLAGYYIETNAVENSDMAFKLRIWGSRDLKEQIINDDGYLDNPSVPVLLHETIIWKKHSYTVNKRGLSGGRGYVYNKIFYFKKPITGSFYKASDGTGTTNDKVRFEIAPVYKDELRKLTDSEKAVKKNDSPVAMANYNARVEAQRKKYPDDSDKHLDKVISFGNPWSTTVESNSGILSVEQPKFDSNGLVTSESVTEDDSFAEFYSDKHGECLKLPPAALTGSNLNGLNAGDAIRIRTNYLNSDETDTGKWTDHIASKGTTFFVKNIGSSPEDSKTHIFLSRRRDSSCKSEGGGKGEYYPIRSRSIKTFAVKQGASFPKIIVEKLALDNLFNAKLKLAVLLKQKPSFQDAYALLRVAASKQNQRNALARTIGADFPGVDTVGHDSFDAKRIFTNYIRYGSAINIYGSSVIPAQRMKVSGSPLYESIRKFVSSYMRVADRYDLINYTIEGGRGVLYFRRFNRFLAKKTKSTILKHMEPSVEPVGIFYEGSKGKSNLNSISHANYKPIVYGENYFVYSPYTTKGATINEEGYYTSETQKVQYPNALGTDVGMRHKALFTGGSNQSYVSNAAELSDNIYNDIGAYEIEGILPESKVKNRSNFPHYSNEWVMFLNGVHYHPSNSHIYKPSVYGDIMGFLNNRCHHRSKEYERRYGEKYDMIRQELLRVPNLPQNDPGPRLHVFLSKSSNNMNYIFNTNSPDSGNLALYGVEDYVRAYRSACPPVTPRPYKVKSCRVVDSNYNDLFSNTNINPSFRKPYGGSTPSGGIYRSPANIIRVELDRPLSRTGRLAVGRNGWMTVDKEQLKDESYRTDENTVLEYLMHNYLGRGGYNCKRMMIGDYGADTDIHEGVGYRPFGACFPRFYFLKLIPYVGKGARLDTDPYAQMDFYIRAMAGEFLKPYIDGPLGKPNTWSHRELLSRSSEEDHTAYYYVDPRQINNS